MINFLSGALISYLILGILGLYSFDDLYEKGRERGKLDSSIAVLQNKELKDLEALRCSYVIETGKIPESLK